MHMLPKEFAGPVEIVIPFLDFLQSYYLIMGDRRLIPLPVITIPAYLQFACARASYFYY